MECYSALKINEQSSHGWTLKAFFFFLSEISQRKTNSQLCMEPLKKGGGGVAVKLREIDSRRMLTGTQMEEMERC